MSDSKEQAISMILRIPEERMTHVIGFLQNLETTEAAGERKSNHMDAFFSAAGKVQIDPDAVQEFRNISMI